MMVKYNLKHKVKEFHVGDCVTVRIPHIDRASTDPNRLPCIIVQVIGTACAMYCLRCKSGVLNKFYSACDMEFIEGYFCLSVKGWECSTCVSLRAALKTSTPWSACLKNRYKSQQAAAHNGDFARRIKLNVPHTVIKEIVAKTRIIHLH